MAGRGQGGAARDWSSAKKAFLTVLRLAFGVGILAYLFRSGQIDFRVLSSVVSAWPITIIAVVFLLTDLTLMAMRISLLFRAMRFHLSLANALRLTLVGFFFSTFLPGAAGGDIAKVYYATRENHGQRAELAGILLFDRLIGLLSLLLLPLLAAPFFPSLIQSVAVLRYVLLLDGLLALSLISVLGLVLSSDRVRRLLSLESLAWLGERNALSRVLATMAAYRRSLAIVVNALLLSLLANCCLIGVTWLAAWALHPFGTSGKLLLVAPIGHLVNSLPLTPGGLGVGETAFAALFRAAGIRGGAETLLCWRVWNVLVGFLGLAIYLFGMERMVGDMPRANRGDPVFSDLEAGSLQSSSKT